MVAKHRRSEDPSLASARARTRGAEFGLRPAGYDQATAWPAGYSDAPSSDYYTPADPGWPPDAEEWFWQDRQAGAAPVLHPDHPSAPVPRVPLPADHPSAPLWSARGPAGPGRQDARGPAAPSPRGPGRARDSGRHESMTATAAVGYLTVRREINEFHHGPGPGRRSSGYQRQVGHGMPDAANYPGDVGQFGPGAAPATAWFQDDHSPDEDPLWMAGQVLTLADGQAAQVAREAQENAAAIREAAEREAAAIRAAAQREAAEQKARLDWMLDELSKVVAVSVAAPALPETAPAAPGEGALPKRTRSAAVAPADAAAVGMTAALPAAMPAPPDTGPGTRPARGLTRPPTKPKAAPAGKPVTKEQRQGRQKNAMRIAKWGTAGLLTFALASAGYMIADHGYGFFVFRENGQGDTPNVQPGRAGDNRLDSTFLAQQAKAAQDAQARQAPKGRHHKTASQPAKGTTAKSTTGG